MFGAGELQWMWYLGTEGSPVAGRVGLSLNNNNMKIVMNKWNKKWDLEMWKYILFRQQCVNRDSSDDSNIMAGGKKKFPVENKGDVGQGLYRQHHCSSSRHSAAHTCCRYTSKSIQCLEWSEVGCCQSSNIRQKSEVNLNKDLFFNQIRGNLQKKKKNHTPWKWTSISTDSKVWRVLLIVTLMCKKKSIRNVDNI